MVQSGAHQPFLIVQQAAQLLPFKPDEVGHIGLQHHGAAVIGAMLGHLHPMIPAHADIEDHMLVHMPPPPLHDPAFRRLALGQFQILRLADQIDIGGKGQPRLQGWAHIGQMHAKPAVAHHQHIIGAKKRKSLLHRLNRIGQVLPRAFGLAIGILKRGIGGVQQIQRAFQFARALAHLIFQHGRALKLGIGRAAIIGNLLHPPHQDLGDRQKLFNLAGRWIGGVYKRVGHKPPPSATSGG